MPRIYRGIVEPSTVNQGTKDAIKDYILKASRNEEVRFPSNLVCYIWFDGDPIRVVRGSYYEHLGSEIYMSHLTDRATPEWVPGALSAVAQFFGVGSDPEIIQAIIKMAIEISAGLYGSITANLAQTFGGLQLTHLAINSKEGLLAGEYPPEVEGDPSVWRLAISGEVVNINEPDWIAFSLQA
jgi:hypothetical protein